MKSKMRKEHPKRSPKKRRKPQNQLEPEGSPDHQRKSDQEVHPKSQRSPNLSHQKRSRQLPIARTKQGNPRNHRISKRIRTRDNTIQKHYQRSPKPPIICDRKRSNAKDKRQLTPFPFPPRFSLLNDIPFILFSSLILHMRSKISHK